MSCWGFTVLFKDILNGYGTDWCYKFRVMLSHSKISFFQLPWCVKFNHKFVSFHIPLRFIFTCHFTKGGLCTEARVRCLAQGHFDRDGHTDLKGLASLFLWWFTLKMTTMPDLAFSHSGGENVVSLQWAKVARKAVSWYFTHLEMLVN